MFDFLFKRNRISFENKIKDAIIKYAAPVEISKALEETSRDSSVHTNEPPVHFYICMGIMHIAAEITEYSDMSRLRDNSVDILTKIINNSSLTELFYNFYTMYEKGIPFLEAQGRIRKFENRYKPKDKFEFIDDMNGVINEWKYGRKKQYSTVSHNSQTHSESDGDNIPFGLKLIKRLGYEDASIALYGLILSRFNRSNADALFLQVSQFVREEFDAASQGNDYSISFVKSICNDPNWYRGAMSENAEIPIDQAGGPQQTLLQIILPIIKIQPDLAIKLRCDITKMFYNDYLLIQSELLQIPCSAFVAGECKKRNERLNFLLRNNNADY